MKQLLIIFAAASLIAGCGADTMSAAATAGALKKQEIEQGKKTLGKMQQRIESATEQMQQSAQHAADAAENN